MAAQGNYTGNSGALLASEVLVDLIGIELAQVSNIPETVWVKILEGERAATAHYRWSNAQSTSTLGTAVEGNSGIGLPLGTYTPSEQTVSVGFGGQTIPVSEAVTSLDPEVLQEVVKTSTTALNRAIDGSLAALYPTLGATVTGSGTSTTLTVNDIFLANSTLIAAHADEVGPFNGRLSAHQFYNLYKDIKNTNYGIAKVDVDAEGKEQITIGGTVLKINSLIPTVNSGANYCGGVYSYQALGLAMGMNPKVMVNYLPGSGEWYVDAMLLFGTAILRSACGVAIVSSTTA